MGLGETLLRCTFGGIGFPVGRRGGPVNPSPSTVEGVLGTDEFVNLADRLARGVDPEEDERALVCGALVPAAAALRARVAAEGLGSPADGARVRDALDSSAGLREKEAERRTRGGGPGGGVSWTSVSGAAVAMAVFKQQGSAVSRIWAPFIRL